MNNKISKLKRKPGIWRIDGYNNIVTYDSGAVPRIYISLSEITENGLNYPLHNGQLTGKQDWIKEPLSRISDIPIGSCWRGGEDGNGVRINRLPAMKKKFTVDTSNVQIVTLDEPIEIKGIEYKTVLPPAAIRLQQHIHNMKRGLYAIVPVLNDKFTEFLVVSCCELYRSYIGVSTRFANNVILGNLNRYLEWNEPKLKAFKALSKLEQFVAYRGNFSEDGKAWLNMPFKHIQYTEYKNRFSPKEQYLYLRSTFPFKGKTTLTIAGKAFKLENGQNYVWGVFAANLLHCSRRADFSEVIVETDRYSRNQLPWLEDVGELPPVDEDPFDEENAEETNELSNTQDSNLGFFNSNNFFGAMQGMKFKHTETNDSKDPVYENDLGDKIDYFSYDEIISNAEDAENIGQYNDFDSHVNNVPRELSDFIRMIITLRDLVEQQKWSIETRTHGPIISIENEIVTTFLNTKKLKKRSWILIGEKDGKRVRQIAWVEVEIKRDHYIYILEMELNDSEVGRSTLCIASKEYKYMEETDFKIFLRMTAAKNRWPNVNHTWKSDRATEIAKDFFERYALYPIKHPSFLTKKEKLDDDALVAWATYIQSKLLNLIT